MSMHGYTKPTDVNGKTAIGPKVDEGIWCGGRSLCCCLLLIEEIE